MAFLQFQYSHVDWSAGTDAEWEAWKPTSMVSVPRATQQRPRRPMSARQRPVMNARFANWYQSAIQDFNAKKKRASLSRPSSAPGKRVRPRPVSREEFLQWYESALTSKERHLKKLKEKYDRLQATAEEPKSVSKSHFEEWYRDAVRSKEKRTEVETAKARNMATSRPVPVFNASHFNDWIEEQTRVLSQ